MEACWSFKSLVGSSCGFNAKYRKRQNQIVPLVSCSKDISKHLGGVPLDHFTNMIIKIRDAC